jgi:hypothetical protein
MPWVRLKENLPIPFSASKIVAGADLFRYWRLNDCSLQRKTRMFYGDMQTCQYVTLKHAKLTWPPSLCITWSWTITCRSTCSLNNNGISKYRYFNVSLLRRSEILYFCTEVPLKKQKIDQSPSNDSFSDVYLRSTLPKLGQGTCHSEITRYVCQYLHGNCTV